jgi:transcriptional regulator with GAF, ATPase, and Fis domain
VKPGVARSLPDGLPLQPSASEPSEAASTLDVLARLAGQVGRDTELYRLLGEIAHATRNLLDIDRVSIFILDGDKLLPAVSASRSADDELWATFRTLPPVAVDLSSGRSLLSSPNAVLIDARVSPVVPQDWRDAFGLTSLALAPLHAGGVPRGVIIGDSGDPRRARLSRDQLQALETVASLAGLAVGRYDAASLVQRSMRALASAVHSLSSAQTAADIARAAASSFFELTDASSASVAIFDETASVVAAETAGHVVVAPDWPAVRERVRGELRVDGHTIVADADRVLVSSVDGDAVVALLQLSGASHLSDDARERVLVLADKVRSTVLRRRSEVTAVTNAAQTSGFAAVASIVSDASNLVTLVERLADPVRSAARAELLEVVIHGRARAQALNLRVASGTDGAQLTRWRRNPAAAAMMLVDGRALVPLRAGGEVIGALVVRTSSETSVDALEHIAAIVAGLLDARILRAELSMQRQAYDNIVARSRLEAAGRRSTLEHLDRAMSSIGPSDAQAHRNGVRTGMDTARLAESLGSARAELTSTQDVLINLANVRGGLSARLKALSRAMARPTMRVDVKATGVGTAEPPGTTQLVVGVREVIGLASAARSSRVLIRLRQEPNALVLDVRADGRLALASGPVGPSSYHVVRTLQRDLEAYGVQVSLDNDGSWFTVRFRLPTLSVGNAKATSTVLSR